MNLTSEYPISWKDLQDKVCKYLNEAGYLAESPKTIKLVRGSIEVDVYAASNNEMIRQFICECKYWNRPVPKEQINAFKTVVAESGANLGIFISTNRFQKGAIDAAYKSNVILKDWNGFTELIKKQWFRKQLFKLAELFGTFNYYSNPLKMIEIINETPSRMKYESIRNRYADCFTKFTFIDSELLEQDNFQVNGITFTDIHKLFCYFTSQFTQGLKEYEELTKDYPNICPTQEYIFSSSLLLLEDILTNKI